MSVDILHYNPKSFTKPNIDLNNKIKKSYSYHLEIVKTAISIQIS